MMFAFASVSAINGTGYWCPHICASATQTSLRRGARVGPPLQQTVVFFFHGTSTTNSRWWRCVVQIQIVFIYTYYYTRTDEKVLANCSCGLIRSYFESVVYMHSTAQPLVSRPLLIAVHSHGKCGLARVAATDGYERDDAPSQESFASPNSIFVPGI